MPDGAIPSPKEDGNFILGPSHNPAPEMFVKEGVPHGQVFEFTRESKDSKIYPGIAREPNTFARQDAADPTKLIISSHPAPYTRRVGVYVPRQYVPRTEAPFIVGADGPDRMLFTALDNLIAEKRVPVMVAISVGNGGGDAQGSERGLEYDTMSGLYAEFLETEVLPLVEKQYNVSGPTTLKARTAHGSSMKPSSLTAHRGRCVSGCMSAIGIISAPATIITIGFSPTRTWPRYSPLRAIVTSLCLRRTPGTVTAA